MTSPATIPYHTNADRLHQLASAYIESCEHELNALGLTLRSSMELEFMVEDTSGMPVPYALFTKRSEFRGPDIENAVKRTMDPDADYIQKVEYESLTKPIGGKIIVETPFQYEANIVDPHLGGAFNPLAVAQVTQRLKEGALKQALLSSTNHDMLLKAYDLYSDRHRCAAPLQPNFTARPYSGKAPSGKGSVFSKLHRETSGLHNNVSLYDKDNSNLFAAYPQLLEDCAHSLAKLQNVAGLAFLPNDNSLQRIEANYSCPRGIGIVTDTKAANKGEYISVSIRQQPRLDEYTGHQTRIENRLAGADADPLVCQALTMAAVLDTVRNYMRKQPGITSFGQALRISEAHYHPSAATVALRPRYAIPDRSKLIERFASGKSVKELLGVDFHRAILHEYGRDKEASLS